jgi:DNA invertase Pin-like site-specific DNA recombinase
MSKKFAILLVRVSTMGQSYDPQTEDLKKYALSLGYNQLKIIETKESGLADLDKKIGTNQLFSFIKDNPKYNVVFSTEISRIGRRQSVLHQIKEWFVRNKIQLFVKDVGYSLFDENGKVTIAGDMMFSLYGLFAESEIKQKKDRFRRSKQSLMELGYSIPGKLLFGYKRVKGEGDKNTYIIDPVNSKVVRTIFNWYINGIDKSEKNVSIRRISIESVKRGFPKYTHSKRNVNKLLKEEGYTGEKTTNNKRKNINYEEGGSEEQYFVTNNKIKYPIIIDRETFDLAQRCLVEKNSKVDKSTKNVTLLSQLIKCEKCDSHYSGNYRVVNGYDRSSYRCSSRSGMNFCKNTKSIGMTLMDNVIWSLIKTDFYLLSKVISNYNPNNEVEPLKNSLKLLDEKISDIDREVTSLSESLKGFKNFKNISGVEFINTISTKLHKLDKERTRLENQKSKDELSLMAKEIDFSNLFNSVKPNLDIIENSKELLKRYLNLFISKINIILQDTRFTIIEVNFNLYSYHPISEQIVPKELYGGSRLVTELKSKTWVILDKINTQKIKTFKTTEGLKLTDNKKGIILTDSQSTRKKKVTIPLEDLHLLQNKDLIDQFLFFKLKSNP